MQAKLISILVDDQDKARTFYTEKLGFVLKHDIDMGGAKWLTVISPEGHDDVEVVLEPNWNPAVPAKAYQKALYDANIPCTAFESTDLQKEYELLLSRGVRFTQPPTPAGPVTLAVFDDTCGNLVQIMQMNN